MSQPSLPLFSSSTSVSPSRSKLDEILTLKQIIRTPLLYLPAVLACLADAFVATTRITTFLTAEELDDPYLINANQELALDLDGDFTWERVGNLPDKAEAPGSTSSIPKKTKKNEAGKDTSNETKDKSAEAEDEEPFVLNHLRLKVPKGAFVAIVGRIGSGKVCLVC